MQNNAPCSVPNALPEKRSPKQAATTAALTQKAVQSNAMSPAQIHATTAEQMAAVNVGNAAAEAVDAVNAPKTPMLHPMA